MAAVIDAIALHGMPPPATRPHQLVGDWAGHQECHVGPDWLLIYQVDDDQVRLFRTGTHSDLFG
jgi:mRNA interferase YafQ